ncbi:MAG: TetR/AcrR family transcriptional regulator [Muribaculaceae bacterium]|nr:TetR/AcrR family transcriptional regulator [Muribaculaceae bacterium]
MTKHQNNKEQAILAAAKEEFLEKGYDGARTTSIARNAGVTHAMLHYYFKTKDQLFERIFRETIGLVGKSLIEVFTNSEKPLLERINDAVDIHFDFIKDNPRLPLFIIREVASHPERFVLVKETLSTVAGSMIKVIEHDLERAASNGEIAKIEATTLMLDILSINAFPFLIQPLFVAAMGDYWSGTEDKFFEMRKRESVEIIMRRLTPNKQ